MIPDLSASHSRHRPKAFNASRRQSREPPTVPVQLNGTLPIRVSMAEVGRHVKWYEERWINIYKRLLENKCRKAATFKMFGFPTMTAGLYFKFFVCHKHGPLAWNLYVPSVSASFLSPTHHTDSLGRVFIRQYEGDEKKLKPEKITDLRKCDAVL